MTADTADIAEVPPRSLKTQLPIMLGGALADHFGLISVFHFLAVSVLLGNFLCLTVPKTEHAA